MDEPQDTMAGAADPSGPWGQYKPSTRADMGTQGPCSKRSGHGKHGNSDNPVYINGPKVQVSGYKILIRNAWFVDKEDFFARMRHERLAKPKDCALSWPASSGTAQIFVTFESMADAVWAYTAFKSWWCEYPDHIAGTKERGPMEVQWCDPAKYD
jgi:hypothetical protein